MWAAVPLTETGSGRREAMLVTDFRDIPEDAERVLFWPRAAGGARPPPRAGRRRVAGLWVIALVMALGGLAMAMARPARAARGRRRAGPALPRWVSEAPLSREAAEQRSLDLLRSVVNRDEWDMFRDLGFICVAGRRPGRAPDGPPRYRYLIYPHLPVVALLPRSMAPVREYCVQFPDRSSAGRHEPPARRRRRPGQVDDPARRRGPAAGLRQHRQRRLPGAPEHGGARHHPPRALARAPAGSERAGSASGPPAPSEAGRLSAVSSSMRR